MAVTQIYDGGSWSAQGWFEFVVFYDSTAKTISLVPTGGPHAVVSLIEASTYTILARLDLDQFGYDGQSHIVAGPGASGVDVNGNPLPTNPVQGNIVNKLNPPKGQLPSLLIGADWYPA